MPDYKAMYYLLAGRMATAVEALEATTTALAIIAERMKVAQRQAEEMFINSDEDADEFEAKDDEGGVGNAGL